MTVAFKERGADRAILFPDPHRKNDEEHLRKAGAQPAQDGQMLFVVATKQQATKLRNVLALINAIISPPLLELIETKGREP